MTQRRTRMAAFVLAGALASLAAMPAAHAGAGGSGSADAGSADAEESSTAVMAPTTFGREATSSIPDAEGASLAAENVSAEEKSQKDQVLAYWTADRLAAAEPLDDVRAAGDEREALGYTEAVEEPEGSTEPALPSQEALDAVAEANTEAEEAQADVVFGVNTSPVNGKLFFESYDHETNNYCSAAVVNTPSKRVIVTAAHCAYDIDSKKWKANAVFVPNYNRSAANPAPLGIWPVRTFRVFDSWILNGTFTNDVAFGTLYNGGTSNQPVATVTGGHGVTWGGSHDAAVTIFGYPTNRTTPANGRYTMLTCSTSATKASNTNEYFIQNCWFLGGASGGPWLENYNAATGIGQLRSITTSGTRGTGNNWGPYLDSSVKTLMDKADADW